MFPPLDEVYPRLVPVHGVQHDLKPDEKEDRKMYVQSKMEALRGSCILDSSQILTTFNTQGVVFHSFTYVIQRYCY